MPRFSSTLRAAAIHASRLRVWRGWPPTVPDLRGLFGSVVSPLPSGSPPVADAAVLTVGAIACRRSPPSAVRAAEPIRSSISLKNGCGSIRRSTLQFLRRPVTCHQSTTVMPIVSGETMSTVTLQLRCS